MFCVGIISFPINSSSAGFNQRTRLFYVNICNHFFYNHLSHALKSLVTHLTTLILILDLNLVFKLNSFFLKSYLFIRTNFKILICNLRSELLCGVYVDLERFISIFNVGTFIIPQLSLEGVTTKGFLKGIK